VRPAIDYTAPGKQVGHIILIEKSFERDEN
jgi:hypothetical protein